MTTLSILCLDSFRMLRSQKLFWIALVMSGLVALVYASIGFNERGVSMFFGLFTFESEVVKAGPDAKRVYMLMFTNVIVRWWLSIIAVILGLISCATIFPEFVRKGSVDLALSKPPPRIVLFLGKYIGSLFFVFLQVLPFAVIVFIAFGIRFGDWNLSIFWAVPLVLLVFSLVYSMHVLVSVWSGSTVFGLLAAFFIWGIGVMTEWAEDFVYQFAYLMPQMGMKMGDLEAGGGIEYVEPKEDSGPGMVLAHKLTMVVRTPIPKTRVVTLQLRNLIVLKGVEDDLAGLSLLESFTMNDEVPGHALEAVERYDKRHSVAADVTSSLIYELVIVGLAAFIFCRRDY